MINGEKIKELMKKRDVTGVELAATVGISEPMVCYIIKGLREPSVTVLVRIADALGCSVDELIRKGA